MKMKTNSIWVLLVACLLGTQTISAQNDVNKKSNRKRMSIEQMVDMQANRISNELGLDDKTSSKFIDLYKKYMKEINDVRKKDMPPIPKTKSDEKKPHSNAPIPKMSDDDVDKMMKERFALSRKILDIREKYYDEFRKFLSPKQVKKIYDQGEMNRGKFQNELNRRQGMRPIK